MSQSGVTSASWSDWAPYFDDGEFAQAMSSMRNVVRVGFSEFKASHVLGLAKKMEIDGDHPIEIVNAVKSELRTAINEFKDSSRSGGATYLALVDLFRMEGDAREYTSATEARWIAFVRLGKQDATLMRVIPGATPHSIEMMGVKEKVHTLRTTGAVAEDGEQDGRKNLLADFRRKPNPQRPSPGWEIGRLRLILDSILTKAASRNPQTTLVKRQQRDSEAVVRGRWLQADTPPVSLVDALSERDVALFMAYAAVCEELAIVADRYRAARLAGHSVPEIAEEWVATKRSCDLVASRIVAGRNIPGSTIDELSDPTIRQLDEKILDLMDKERRALSEMVTPFDLLPREAPTLAHDKQLP